jgi:hypothetical protein
MADESMDPEVQRLREQVQQLESELASTGPNRSATGTLRWIAFALVSLLLFVLAPVSVLGAWAQSIVFDTDRYVATVTPLAEDPAVQDAIAQQLTDQILTKIDVQDVVDSVAQNLSDAGVPDAVNLLKPLAVSGIENLITSAVDQVVASDAFQTAWIEANRAAHESLVDALTGANDGAATVEDGEVRIRTAAFLEAIKDALSGTRLSGIADRIPDVDATFVVFESNNLANIQTGMKLLDTAGNWLPVLTLLLAIGAVALAPNRRRGVMLVGITLAVSMLLVAVLLAVGRVATQDAAQSLNADAAVAIYDQVVTYLRISLRAVAVAGLIAALVAWLVGPSGPAVGIRGGIRRGIDYTRQATVGDATPGPARAWLVRYRRPVQAVIIGVGVVAVLFWPYPTAVVVIGLLLLVLLGLALVQVFGTGPRAAAPQSQEAGDRDQ